MERMLKVYAGSISYGLDTKDSDIDIRGIIKNPVEQLFGIESDFVIVRNKNYFYYIRACIKN